MRNSWFIAIIWLFSSAASAFQVIDTSTYFPAVVQGHRDDTNANCNGVTDSKLTLNGQSKINGTGGVALNFCDSNQGSGMPLDACDRANGGRQLCPVTQNTIRGLPTSGGNDFLVSSGINGGIDSCSNGQQLTLGGVSQNQFRAISLYSSCTLTFSSARQEYLIETLEIGSGAKVVLPTGDYWINTLTVNGGGEIQLQGNVRIFVNTVAFNSGRLNGNSAGSALLFSYGGVRLNGTSLINGFIYANNELAVNDTSIINGRTTSKSLVMSGSAAINDKIPEPSLICETPETFNSANSLAMWALSAADKSTLPSVINGRLQLTTNANSQSTAATYKMLFPGADNRVVLEFDHFAYGGSGADGMAIVLSDGLVTAQPGASGGPLGYGARSNVNGFAGGWLGIGLDEFGNFSTEGGPRGAGPGARRPQSVVIRGSGSGTSGYSYLAGACVNGTQNTGSCLSPRVDGNGSANPVHRYRIEVDSRQSNKTFVEVSRRTSGNQFTILIPRFELKGQVTTPNDFQLSLTGSTGGSTNFHELDNFQVCALKSRPLNVQIDHFRFDYSRIPLTCNPQDVTLTACANSDCSVQYKGAVTAYLLPKKLAQGEWRDSQGNVLANDQVTFSGGKVDLRLRSPIKGKITLGVEGSTPATRPLSTTVCRMGSGAYSIGACTIDFADSGFIFDVLDTYSNQPQDVTISAVKKDDITKQCVPGFTGVRSVGFWGAYSNPNTNNFGSKISIDGNPIATYAASVSSPTATTLNLTFDGQGKATLKKVTYPDAGQMQLYASHNGSGDTAGLVMTGSDAFVARPVGLCITLPQGVCTAGDSSCPVFKKAGETFQVDIKAMAWESANDGDICAGNQTTPNFFLPNIGLGSTLVAPNPGTNAAVGTATYNHVAATNSINSVNQTVSEVGVFRMTATPPANGYFTYTIPSAQSLPVGRFIPADFNLVSGDIVPACNAFTYMGQPFGVTLDVRARNLSGGQTQNYTGLFAKGDAYLSVANNKDGKSLSSRLRSLQPLPWLNGRAALTTGSSEFVRLSDTQPDGPYKSLLFGLYMRDNDGDRTLIASPNFNDAVVGNCSGSGCNARQIDSVPMTAYFGRLLAGTEAGVASAPLAIPQRMQYYEAGNWLLNKEDQCTQLSLANQGFTFINSSQTFDAATRELNLGAGRKIKLGLGSSAPGGDAALAKDGEILFHFAKPDISVRIPYKVDLVKQPSSPTWLSDPTSLQGEAIFGSSRGNDRIIYRREVMQ
ncbi:DUF6701 domain-containing protein [Aeromonas sobria]|uniref:DUF6701 domain-containing protein n=1 Tax=Aeromonas sobria TaxID=646 RepID=UPI003F3F792D